MKSEELPSKIIAKQLKVNGLFGSEWNISFMSSHKNDQNGWKKFIRIRIVRTQNAFKCMCLCVRAYVEYKMIQFYDTKH